MKTARQLAVDVLLKVEKDAAYSVIALDQAVKAAKLSGADASFAAALVYGVLERQITLDAIIGQYVKKGVRALDREILILLRMGVYQLCFMDGVPARAAINETVSLVPYVKKTSARGMVNAILRNVQRAGADVLSFAKRYAPIERLSVETSCPVWLLKQWETQYSRADAEAMAKAALERPPLYARVNPLKTDADTLCEVLARQGVTAQKHEWIENCVVLSDTGSLLRLDAFRDGWFHIQDAASQLCAQALGAQPGDTVLDVCAAPGSKSFTIAQQMNNQGAVHAFDLYEHKCRLIEEGAQRLGLSIVDASVRDARTGDDLPMADRILCDVPCSGLGILRRKPEIRFKDPASFADLPKLQYEILSHSAKSLKPGGVLVYSTCTTNKAENEDVVLRFLSENNWAAPLNLSEKFGKIDFIQDFMAVLLPHQTNTDGFFFAAMTRRE